MKVLFTSFSYYPETSGVPIVVQYLAEGLAARGHEVCVVTRKNGHDFVDEEIINGVQVRRFGIGQTLTKRNTGNIREYIDFVRKWPKDVLVLECLQCHTTDLLLPYLKDLECKVVIHSHGAPGIRMKMFKWCGDVTHSIGHTANWLRYKKYYKYTLPSCGKYVDMGISLSLCADDLVYFTKHVNKTTILENAANKIFFEEKDYDIDLAPVLNLESKNYIVNISNYTHNKNQTLLIKEFEKAELKDCALVLIGSKKNAYYNRVCQLAKRVSERSGCEIIILTGIDRMYFPSIIHHAILFAMTSKLEQYPVSLVEAMAVGTPFISTMVGNAHTLPGGVVARDNEEISVLLKTLYDNPSLRKRLGEQGKCYASKYNTTQAATLALETILEDLYTNQL